MKIKTDDTFSLPFNTQFLSSECFFNYSVIITKTKASRGFARVWQVQDQPLSTELQQRLVVWTRFSSPNRPSSTGLSFFFCASIPLLARLPSSFCNPNNPIWPARSCVAAIISLMIVITVEHWRALRLEWIRSLEREAKNAICGQRVWGHRAEIEIFIFFSPFWVLSR